MHLNFTPSPNFERVKKALLCEIPDRVPLAELWIDSKLKEKFIGKKIGDAISHKDYNVKNDIEFWEKAGYNFIHIIPDYRFPINETIVKDQNNLYSDSEKRNWAQLEKGLISNWNEFDRYSWPDPDSVNYTCLEIASKSLPKGMKIITGTNGAFEATWMIMGFRTFCLNLKENPELVEKVFLKTGEILTRIFKKASSFENIDAMWVSDDIAYTSGLTISPEIYRKNLFPWYEEMALICKEKELPFIFHSDGNLIEVIDDLIAIGFNALHPVEPKAMDIRELKNKYENKLCLIGNIDLGYTLTRGTPENVEEEVKLRIKEIGRNSGYCVGSSNSITGYVPLENYTAMLNAVFKYGKYPVC